MRTWALLAVALCACGRSPQWPPQAADACASPVLPPIVPGSARVTFTGNRGVTSDDLRAVVRVGRNLGEDTLEEDQQALTNLYLDRGYWSAKVSVTRATREAVDFAIDEGPHFRLRSLKFSDGPQGPAVALVGADARASLESNEGSWVARCALLAGIARLRAAYRASGFDADIEPRTELFPALGAIDIVVSVRPRPMAPVATVEAKRPRHYACSGAEIDLDRHSGCTIGDVRPGQAMPDPLDAASVQVQLDGGDGWTSNGQTHDLYFSVKNSTSHYVRFQFDEGCGEHGSWTTANYTPAGESVDAVSWEGCPTVRLVNAECQPDVYDIELPPDGVMRRRAAFFPVRSVTPTPCHQTLEPLSAGTYEARVTTPVPLVGGGWLTAKTAMQVR